MEAKTALAELLKNLEIKNTDEIAITFKGVTKKCNQVYWESDSEDDHSKQIGSIGRKTAIDGLSDVDMLFILPNNLFEKYNDYETNGQSALLQDVKLTLLEKYPDSDISADGQIIKFNHSKFVVELLPCFVQATDSYTYADSNDGGSWKLTKPQQEIDEIESFDSATGGILRALCKMTRAWKNNAGVPLGGLLIDTLCYNFLKTHTSFHGISFEKYAEMLSAFFEFVGNQDPDQEHWIAPGSGQHVYKKANFVGKAKKAKTNCDKAIAKNGLESARKYWKRIFGRPFPVAVRNESERRQFNFDDTEQFIEDSFPVDIKGKLQVECKVTQDGFRPFLLNPLSFLQPKKSLEFFVKSTSIPEPYTLFWKVLNVGPEAEKRNKIRGEILPDSGSKIRKESTQFKGEHIVEAYIVKSGVVVAKDTIPVNIDDSEV
jgi:hypothetical protein